MFQHSKIFLSTAFAAMFFATGAIPVSAASPVNSVQPAITGGGGNLTSFSGNIGALNNNQWNSMMNPGKGTPTADFGNCNSLILRCAQPKCAGGGCFDMEVASAIVRGCVESNASCRLHGESLVSSIAGQMVAQSLAKSAEQAAAAQAAAASSSSAQSDAQLQQMQYQLQQMQQTMAEQQQASAARIEAALAEQQQFAAQQAAAQAAAAAQANQAESVISQGVSAEVLARNQASGAILTKLEDMNAALRTVKATMQTVFDYAGCNTNGENCKGPTRVTTFKEKAIGFFDPFENVQDQVYDALLQAQALGVDISDIYMMLNGSCNVWGKYLCTGNATVEKDANGKVLPGQSGCQLIQMLTNSVEVQQNWLDVQEGGRGQTIQIACASDAIETSKFFANRRNKIDDVGIDDLALVLGQDAQIVYNNNNTNTVTLNPCYDKDKISYTKLQGILMTGGGSENYFVDSSGTPEPYAAMCTIHVLNVSGDAMANPADENSRQEMNRVVAAKSELITREMKKQYDYLDATVKRFQMQLQKAVLVAQNEAAGAAPGYAAAGQSRYENCGFKGLEESIRCVRSNLGQYQNSLSANTYPSGMLNSVKNDADIIRSFMISQKIDTKAFDAKCATKSMTNAQIPGCMQEINTGLVALERSQKTSFENMRDR